jgi:glycosyltransferase involved in cell wall biosynthesis
MKVLFLAPYIYSETLSQFRKNQTGFGLMLNAIIKHVSKIDETYLLTHVITKVEKFNSTTILNHTWKDIVFSLDVKYLFRGVKDVFRFKQKIRNRLLYFFYNLDAGYTKKVIKTIQPDVVHIHGIGYSTKPYIDICKELGIPFVVTLHGLIGLNDRILVAKHEKELEKEFLRKSEVENTSVTVISSGIKNRILSNYDLLGGNNIKVVPNGTTVKTEGFNGINIREKYKIPKGKRIAVCIGNICERKNQVEIINAFHAMKEEERINTIIFFIGNDTLNGTLQKKIDDLGYTNHLICCGFIEKKELPFYLKQADLNIVASVDEGFGLSIIEGFVYGVPTVTFSDLDAIEDLYNENAMLLVHDRSAKELAQGISMAFYKKWDKKWIKQYSRNFSLEKMAKQYHICYLETTSKG